MRTASMQAHIPPSAASTLIGKEGIVFTSEEHVTGLQNEDIDTGSEYSVVKQLIKDIDLNKFCLDSQFI